MTKQEEFEYVEDKIDQEGLGYYLMDYTDSGEMPDEKSRELFDRASGAMRDFVDYIEEMARG